MHLITMSNCGYFRLPFLFLNISGCILFFLCFAGLRKLNPQPFGESAHLLQLKYLFSEGHDFRKVSTWLFLKQWIFHLSLDKYWVTYYSCLTPNLFTLSSFFPLSSSSKGFILHRSSNCAIHFTLDISMSFKYPRRILFLCVYQLNWCGQKGTYYTPFAGTISYDQ